MHAHVKPEVNAERMLPLPALTSPSCKTDTAVQVCQYFSPAGWDWSAMQDTSYIQSVPLPLLAFSVSSEAPLSACSLPNNLYQGPQALEVLWLTPAADTQTSPAL